MVDAWRGASSYDRDMSSAANTMITLARRSQRWLRSHPRFVDVLVACLMALVALADFSAGDAYEGAREPDSFGVILVVVGATALVWRRVAPVVVMVFVVAVSCVFYALNYDSFMAAIGLAALYSVVAHEKNRRVAWIALGVAWVVLFGVARFTVLDGIDGFRRSDGIGMTLSIGATLIAGAVIHNREEIFADTKARAERAEANRKAEAEQAVIGERLRIAREMHDVVAHAMSLITVQAAAAQEIVESRPDAAAKLMHSVEATGRDALAEMRRMLGVLRNDDTTTATPARGSLAPQPSLADLTATIAQCIEAGTPSELTISGDERPLSPGVELAAFRIVQEALTNVVKHGGDKATATVELHYGADLLHLKVTDTGRGAVSKLVDAGGGHGLIGMRERIEIYGGQLAAGPRPGGGYQVDASLAVSAASDRTAVSLTEPERKTAI
jgi:signal transduction histidine kinase